MVQVRFSFQTVQRAVPWARLGSVSESIARKYPTQQPSILILGTPRSGSSWVGMVLGNAGNALYLREPITQSCRSQGFLEEGVVVDIDPQTPPGFYERFGDMAFMGLPKLGGGVAAMPEQWWSLSERKRRRLVVKEVNPLACEWLLSKYKPRTVLLVRHPAATALSYHSLGWGSMDARVLQISSERLAQGPLAAWKEYLGQKKSTWEWFGAFFGASLRVAVDALKDYSDYRILIYEELCGAPTATFADLFVWSGLDWNDKVEELIASSSSGGDTNERYGLSRDSANMIQSWRSGIAKRDLDDLRNGFQSFDLPWYRESEYW